MRWITLTDGEQVSLKTIIACGAFLFIIIAACACMVMSIKVDPGFLWPVIALIFGFAGVSAASFAQFRTSDYGYLERKGDADAKVASATKATPPVPVVQPASPAVEIHS